MQPSHTLLLYLMHVLCRMCEWSTLSKYIFSIQCSRHVFPSPSPPDFSAPSSFSPFQSDASHHDSSHKIYTSAFHAPSYARTHLFGAVHSNGRHRCLPESLLAAELCHRLTRLDIGRRQSTHDVSAVDSGTWIACLS